MIISYRQYAEHVRPFCHSQEILGRKGFQVISLLETDAFVVFT